MLSPQMRTPGSKARRVKLVTAPTAEPIGFELQKEAIRLNVNSESFSTMMRIRTARTSVEKAINRKLIQQTWDLFLDDEAYVGDRHSFFIPFYMASSYREYRQEIALPFPPVQSVLGVYTRLCGEETLVDPCVYSVSTASEPCRIRLNPGQVWPEHDGFESFRVRFTCGYATPVTMGPDGTITASNHGYQNGDSIIFTSLDGTLPPPLAWGQSYVIVNLTSTTFAITDLDGNVITPADGTNGSNDWGGTMFMGEVPSPLIEAMVLLSGLNLASDSPQRIPGLSGSGGRVNGYELPVEPVELLAQFYWPEMA